MNALHITLPSGPAGSRATVAAILGVVHGGLHDPRLATIARQLNESAPSGMAHSVFDWVRSRFAFASDPPGLDTAQTVTSMLDAIERDGRAVGDCVHRAILTAALLKAAGFPAFLVIVSRNPTDTSFEHVYAATGSGRYGLIPLDSQECAQPGIEPAGVVRREVFAV